MTHVHIWPDRPDDPPVTLPDGSAADWLRWGSTVKGGSDGDSLDVTDDADASDGDVYAKGRVFVYEL